MPDETGVTVSNSPQGATIATKYLARTQEIVGVNRSDLEDILEFDASEVWFGGFGTFLASGAVWLAVEKVLEQEVYQMTPLLWVCLLCVCVGAFLIYQGFKMHGRKRSRIERIFSETRELVGPTSATPSLNP